MRTPPPGAYRPPTQARPEWRACLFHLRHDSGGRINPDLRPGCINRWVPEPGRRAASSIQTAGSLLLLKVHILNFVTGLLIIIGKTEDGVLSLVIGQDGVALIERSLL